MKATDDTGSAVAEFVMVSALLTVLALSVLQLALALLVRNTIVDAAAEGARFGALADHVAADGRARTIELISTALNPEYASDVTAGVEDSVVVVTVRAPLPVIGLIGPRAALEVSGHAAIESVG